MGVTMRLPRGLTLNILRNYYNADKRLKRIPINTEHNRNLYVAQWRRKNNIRTASGVPLRPFYSAYERYSILREANQRNRSHRTVRRAAGKFKAGLSVAAVRPALSRNLGAFGKNYGNMLRSIAYRNASPIKHRRTPRSSPRR